MIINIAFSCVNTVMEEATELQIWFHALNDHSVSAILQRNIHHAQRDFIQ